MTPSLEKANGDKTPLAAAPDHNLYTESSAPLDTVKIAAPAANDNAHDPDGITVLYDPEARHVGAKHVTPDGVGRRAEPLLDASNRELVIHTTEIARDFPALIELRTKLLDMPYAYTVGGATRKPSSEPQHRLSAHSHGDARTLEDTPRHWLDIDIDLEPADIEKHNVPAEIVEAFPREQLRAAQYIRDRLLPDCFHDAMCLAQATGSAGVKPGEIRLRLTFRMQPGITCVQSKVLLARQIEAGICDGSIYRPEMARYTAKPIFEGGATDPMASRIGVLEGTPEVQLPDLSQLESARPNRSADAYERKSPWRERIADLASTATKRNDLNSIAYQAGQAGASFDELWALAEPALARNTDKPVKNWDQAEEIAHKGYDAGRAESERRAAERAAEGAALWARLAAFRAAAPERAEALAALAAERAAAQATRIASRIQDTGLDAPYTREEVEQWAADAGDTFDHFQKRWIIQKGDAYYLLARGTYRGPFSGKEFKAAAAKWFAPARDFVQLRWPAQTGGEGARKSLDDLVDQYGTHASVLVESLEAQTSRYDARTHTLIRAMHPLRELPPLTPDDLEFVQAWVARSWAPDVRPYVLDWFATAMDLSQPAPVLQLRGAPGTGKNAIAAGIGRLWHETRAPYTDLERLLGDFGGGLETSPLAFADEKLPEVRGQQLSTRLRAVIFGQSFPLNRKYQPEAQVQGSIRIVVGLNAENAAAALGRAGREELSDSDIRAIATRFIDAPFAPSCPELSGPDARRLIQGDVLARYCHWLSDPANHTVHPTTRGACRATSDEMARSFVAMHGRTEAIIRHAAEATMRAPGPLFHSRIQREGSGVAWRQLADGPAIYVCSSLIAKQHDIYGAFTKQPTVPDVQSAMGACCDRKDTWRPYKGSATKHNGRFYRLRPEYLATWLKSSDYDADAFAKALAAKADALGAAEVGGEG